MAAQQHVDEYNISSDFIADVQGHKSRKREISTGKFETF